MSEVTHYLLELRPSLHGGWLNAPAKRLAMLEKAVERYGFKVVDHREIPGAPPRQQAPRVEGTVTAAVSPPALPSIEAISFPLLHIEDEE